jgi:hypothetical protein
MSRSAEEGLIVMSLIAGRLKTFKPISSLGRGVSESLVIIDSGRVIGVRTVLN